jgi:hypothetical protein
MPKNQPKQLLINDWWPWKTETSYFKLFYALIENMYFSTCFYQLKESKNVIVN